VKRSDLTKLIKEMLDEANITSTGGGSFPPGDGAQYATPKAFGKGNKAKKTLTKLGYKQVSRPTRPSHTKGFDYI